MYYDRGHFYVPYAYEYDIVSPLSGSIVDIGTIGHDGNYFTPKLLKFTAIGHGRDSSVPDDIFSVSAGFASYNGTKLCLSFASLLTTLQRYTIHRFSNEGCIEVLYRDSQPLIRMEPFFNPSGFQLIVHAPIKTFSGAYYTNSSGHQFFWEAWGGPDITDVTIHSGEGCPNTTGVVRDTIASGFNTNASSNILESRQDQCIMTIELPTTSTNPFAGSARLNVIEATNNGNNGIGSLSFGYCISPSSQINKSCALLTYNYCGTQTNPWVTYAASYASGGIMLGYVTNTGVNSSGYTSYYGENKFNYQIIRAPFTNKQGLIYATIKGGYWDIGSITANTKQTNVITSKTNFDIIGGHLLSTGSGIGLFNRSVFCIGSFSKNFDNSIDCGSMAVFGIPYADPQFAAGRHRFNRSSNQNIFIGASTLAPQLPGASWTINSIIGNEFTITNTTATNNHSQENLYYLVFGNKNNNTQTTSVGHPFIS